MAVPNYLIEKFAKMSKEAKIQRETTVFGTTVEYGGKLYVKMDGSDLLTPVATTSEIAAGERVTVMVKDHTATVTGNISNPSASKKTTDAIEDEITTIVADIGNFETLIADKATIGELNAEIARVEELIAGEAYITDLNAIKADIENLHADVAEIDLAIIDKADIVDLDAANAEIAILQSSVASIETLVGGNLTMDNIQSLVLTTSKVTVDNAFIKDAMIDRVSASKLTAGTINTNLINIVSDDGSLSINGNLQQFKDENGNVRIQIGKDASGDFTFALYGADGTGQLINQNGITASAIGDGLIVNDMVADNAAISGDKLDIRSVITEINGNETKINSSTIYMDGQNQSLDIAFSALKTQVDTIQDVTIDGDLSSIVEQVQSNTTAINVAQGNINTLISNTTITKENGEVVQLKDDYSVFKQDVDSINTKVSTLETTVDTVNTKNSEIEQRLDGIDLTVDERTIVSNEEGIIVYVKEQLTQTINDLDGIINKVSGIESHFDDDGTVTSLVEKVSTLEQTTSQFTMEFFEKIDQSNQDITQLMSYITFNADGITIGQADYPVRLMLTKDRIKFINTSDQQIAYFSEGKLYVEDAEILDSIKIANYGFLPAANGSLTIGAIK